LIPQEGHAYFFCVEDRALLCRSCDVAVHTANAFVSAHRRFLLTGVQVGLEPEEQEDPLPEPDPQPPNNASSAPLQPPACERKRSPTPLYSDGDIDWAAGPDVGITGNLPDWSVIDEQFGSGSAALTPTEQPAVIKAPPKKIPRVAVTPASAALFGGSMPDWPLDEFFGFTEFNSGFGFAENGTSKADSGKLSSPNRRSMSSSSSGNTATQNAQDFFGQVPEVHWSTMPELPSPPTASGLHWQGDQHYGSAADNAAVFVPDICSPENSFRCFTTGGDQQPKRRRRG